MRRPGEDDGVAALEMAIITVVLMILGFGALPLFAVMNAHQTTTKASTETVRYATSVDANAHTVHASTGDVMSRRPSADDVTRFAQATANDPSLTVVVKVCPGGNMAACAAPVDSTQPLTAASGDTVTVTVSKTVDLSLLASIANAATSLAGQGAVYAGGVTVVSSTSTGREE